MKTIQRHIAVEIPSDRDTLRVSSVPVFIGNAKYQNQIVNFEFKRPNVNIIDFSSGVSDLEIEVYGKENLYLKNFQNSNCFIYEFYINEDDLDSESLTISSGNKKIEYKKYSGKIISSRYLNYKFIFSIEFAQDESMNFSNQKFNMHTYAKYLMTRIHPRKIETYIPIPDFDTEGLVKLGRFASSQMPFFNFGEVELTGSVFADAPQYIQTFDTDARQNWTNVFNGKTILPTISPAVSIYNEAIIEMFNNIAKRDRDWLGGLSPLPMSYEFISSLLNLRESFGNFELYSHPISGKGDQEDPNTSLTIQEWPKTRTPFWPHREVRINISMFDFLSLRNRDVYSFSDFVEQLSLKYSNIRSNNEFSSPVGEYVSGNDFGYNSGSGSEYFFPPNLTPQNAPYFTLPPCLAFNIEDETPSSDRQSKSIFVSNFEIKDFFGNSPKDNFDSEYWGNNSYSDVLTDNKGFLILYSIPNPNSVSLAEDKEELKDEIEKMNTESLSIAPLAFSYSKYQIYMEYPTVEFTDYLDIVKDPRRAFMSFILNGVYDLRKMYPFRTREIIKQTIEGDGNWEEVPAFTIFYNQIRDPSEVNLATFNPRITMQPNEELIPEEVSGLIPADLGMEALAQAAQFSAQPGEFMVAMVPALNFLREFDVNLAEYKFASLDFLVGNRLDIINPKNSDKQLLSFFTEEVSLSGESIDEIETTSTQQRIDDFDLENHSIYELSNGEFAFIEDVVNEVNEGQLVARIILNSPIQSIQQYKDILTPNTIARISSESFSILTGIISLRGVPENISTEGENIPIVYGYVEKFPIIHTVSKKAAFDSEVSAGDDIYTICAHPIVNQDHNSVTIYWGLDQFREAGGKLGLPGEDINTFHAGLDKSKKYWLENPFPAVKEVNLTRQSTIEQIPVNSDVFQNRFDNILRVPTEDHIKTLAVNPYHYLLNIEDNSGNIHSAIKLRGDEWNPSLGAHDARFPIRFGLGNQNLFASFCGMPDDKMGSVTGIPSGPICHPAHILHHLIKVYGNLLSPSEEIDKKAFEYIYSNTPELALSVYLADDEINIWDVAQEIAAHSFIYLIYNEGKYSARYLDLDPEQFSKASFDDTINTDTIQSQMFFEGNTSYRFRYKYDFVTDNFTREVRLDNMNNIDCRLAYKKNSVNKTKEVEFPYIFEEAVVNKVIKKYTSLFSRSRTKISFNTPLTEKIMKLKELDIIDVTSKDTFDYAKNKLGIEQEKFIVETIAINDDTGVVTIDAMQLLGG